MNVFKQFLSDMNINSINELLKYFNNNKELNIPNVYTINNIITFFICSEFNYELDFDENLINFYITFFKEGQYKNNETFMLYGDCEGKKDFSSQLIRTVIELNL